MPAEDGPNLRGRPGVLQGVLARLLFLVAARARWSAPLELVRREFACAVLVHVDDLAGGDVHAGHRDRHVDGVDRHGAVAGGDAAEHVLEAHRADLVDVARGAVGDAAQAAHGLHGRGHVAAGEAHLAGDLRRELLL